MDKAALEAAKLKLQADAGIPHLPTDLTYECRKALSGAGPRAFTWKDKPHRLVFDLCGEIERLAALPSPEPVAWMDRHVLARLVPDEVGTAYGKPQDQFSAPLFAALPSQREVIEECAVKAKDWLDNWGADLWATFESYVEAQTSGKHNGRRIDPQQAKAYAGQFRERAEAVAGCSDDVAAAIRSLATGGRP